MKDTGFDAMPAKPGPGIGQAIALCALYIVVATMVAILLLLTKSTMDTMMAMFIQNVVAWSVTLPAGLWWSRAQAKEAFPFRPFPVQIVPALVIGTWGLTLLLVGTATLIPAPDWWKNAMEKLLAGTAKWTMFLPVVVVAPLAEELFFRGLVLRGFLQRYSVTKAVWASSILFAVFHLNPWQVFVALPLGLFMAWLFLCTRSLWPCIIAHVTANFGTNYLLPLLARVLGYDQEEWKALRSYPPSVFAIAGALAVVGGAILWKQLQSRHASLSAPGGESQTSAAIPTLGLSDGGGIE
ncbi:MAG: CPBP family intramembrane glutamic endopeptidase [Candidatus Sumerlaeaceae bacterium]